MPAAHLPEFRQRAFKLARAGHTLLGKPVKDLRISESCLRNSMAQADADDNGSATRGDGKVRVTRARVAPGWSRRDGCPLAAGGRTGTRMPASLPAAGADPAVPLPQHRAWRRHSRARRRAGWPALASRVEPEAVLVDGDGAEHLLVAGSVSVLGSAGAHAAVLPCRA